MVDKESMLRELARQDYELLRTRPRPADDTPSLKAYFAPAGETLPQGVDRFHALATEFVGANPFVEGWIVVRTPQDHAAKTGLYVLENNDEFLDFLRKRKTRDDHFTINASAFSTQINPGDRYTATGTINYSGGTSKFRSDKLYFSAGASDVRDNNLTLQEYLTMIRLIVAWREPRLIVVGSGTYETYDRVFWHRAWNGWIGWFPQQIDPSILPDFAMTWRIGNGTAVATQETNVLSRYPDQRQRANEVEMALTDAGILPTTDEVLGVN